MEASFSSMYSNITTVDPVTIMEERAISSDNSGDNSPSCTNFPTSTSSPKRRRAIQKKIMNIPIKDLDGSKFKSDCTPPSDSWAWRKYGQKPIKGSPYPRGYYRCSSSKGCPARKQVERSRSDPTMLVVTYSYDHNHPWPTSRNHHHQSRTTTTTTAATSTTLVEVKPTPTTKTITLNNNNQITHFPQNNINGHNNSIISPTMDHLHQPLIPPTDELPWVTSDHEILQNDFIFNNNYNFNDLDMAKFFPMREEDESLFADLGELPECPVVFHRAAGDEPVNLTPWCGSTG